MASTATVTGRIGPASTVAAQVFTGVVRIELDCNNEILSLFFEAGRQPVLIEVAAQTTWTVTVSGNTYTVSVS